MFAAIQRKNVIESNLDHYAGTPARDDAPLPYFQII